MSARGQRLYDRWSRHRGAFGLLYDIAFLGREDELRQRGINALAPETGENVLEIGCGPGMNFDALRTAVGAEGHVVGADYVKDRRKARLFRGGIRAVSCPVVLHNCHLPRRWPA